MTPILGQVQLSAQPHAVSGFTCICVHTKALLQETSASPPKPGESLGLIRLLTSLK